MENLKDEIVDNDEILNIVNEIKTLIKESRYNKDSIKDLKKGYPDKFTELEEISIIWIGENDLVILKTEFADIERKYLTKKLAYPYDYFNTLDDYQKPVDNLKKEKFFSKLKNDCPCDQKKHKII